MNSIKLIVLHNTTRGEWLRRKLLKKPSSVILGG